MVNVDEKILKKEESFYSDIVCDVEKAEIEYNRYSEYFSEKTPKDDYQELIPDFKRYTQLIWERLTKYPEEVVIGVGMRRQVPVALKLGYDVWEEIMWYLAVRTMVFDPDTRAKMYLMMKTEFLESEAVLGEYLNKFYTVVDAVEDVKKINSSTADSIKSAEITTKIKNILFPKLDSSNKLFSENQSEVVDRFIGLINFFLGIKAEDINIVVERFTHPDISEFLNKVNEKEKIKPVSSAPLAERKIPKENNIKKIEKKDEAKKTIQSQSVQISERNITSQFFKKPEPMFIDTKTSTPARSDDRISRDENVMAPKALAKPNVVSVSKRDELKNSVQQKKMTYSEIKKQIDLKFAKDKLGNFLNISDVLMELGRIAAAEGDVRIKDLYYFNEQNGDFEWNSNLIKD